MSNSKGCLTCANHKNSMCSLPPEGKQFCLADGNYECWKPAGEAATNQVVEEMTDAQEVEALDELNGMFTEEQKAEADQKLKMFEKLKDGGKNFSGFNGVEIVPGVVKATACGGCIHYSSMVGCILNRLSDCTTNGRYLFVQNTAPASSEEEGG